MNKKNILIIPHSPLLNVKIRSQEISKILEKKNNVYYLIWDPYLSISPKTLFKKILNEIKQIFLFKPKIVLKNNLLFVKISTLYRPQKNMGKYNQWQLTRFIKKYKINLVISANTYYYPVPKIKNVKYIYDLVDDHTSICISKTKNYVENFIKNEIEKADKIITISNSLIKIIKERYQKNAVFIPNGVFLSQFTEFSEIELEAIREKYKLKGKFVIGFIGNHGSWSGLDFLIEVFNKLNISNKCLFIVGGGSEIEKLEKLANENIIFTKSISPEKINLYFKVIDLGVLPFVKIPFTDYAFPLKVLEYGAAGKKVIATPLQELVYLNFPHIVLTERKIENWVYAIEKEKNNIWNSEWDEAIKKYDWNVIIQKLQKIIEG